MSGLRKINFPLSILLLNIKLRITIILMFISHLCVVGKVPRKLPEKLMVRNLPNSCCGAIFKSCKHTTRDIRRFWQVTRLKLQSNDVAIKFKLCADHLRGVCVHGSKISLDNSGIH